MSRRIRIFLAVLLLTPAILLSGLWFFCRIDVPPDKCMVLIRKTGAVLPAGEVIADQGQRGIQRETYGPGRYFLNPLVWDYELHDLVVVSAGDPKTWIDGYVQTSDSPESPRPSGKRPQVGVVVQKVGKSDPEGRPVVDSGYAGIQKQVLTPGTYRLNPYVYKVELFPATVVPLGCAGIVVSQFGTSPDYTTIEDVSIGPDGEPVSTGTRRVQMLAGEGERGVCRDVLQPGVYYLNPYVYRVEIVQVGFNQLEQVKTSQASSSISFPSKDGFTVTVDAIAIWGRDPAHTPEMINRFGSVSKVQELVLANMRSICRNVGSEYESTDFIRGEKRERYQLAVTDTLRNACRQRDIEILITLIHNIEVHSNGPRDMESEDLKSTIQRGFIAREEEISRQAQREAAKIKADLEATRATIEVARETVAADTRKRVAEIAAEADRKAREIRARAEMEIASIDRQIAELEADRTRLLGKARAAVERLTGQAKADGQRMLVDALGGGRAYNLYTFAESFSPEAINLIYAGEGTMWTDLRRLTEANALRDMGDSAEK